MRAPSLQARLLIGAAVAIFVALAVAWVAMGFLFERHVSHRINDDLKANGEQLISSLSIAANGAPALALDLTDPRFQMPDSGYFWEVSTTGGTLRSASLGGKSLNRITQPGREIWTNRIEDGPEGNDLYYLERIAQPVKGGPDVLVQLAHDHNSIATASTEFSMELGVFLLILGAFLCLAAWAQVYLGLRPFKQVRDQLLGMERDPAVRLGGVQPQELRPLIDAINALAGAREQDLKHARGRAADLAHSLKTPLAVLSAHARRLRAEGASEAASGIERAVNAAAAAVHSELAQTRSAIVSRSRSGAAVRACCERVVQVLEQTEAGGRIVFNIDIDEDFTISASEEAMTETVGPLLENAARFASRQVRITARRDGERVEIAIEDDGPGIAREQIDLAMQRGGRLDEGGHGLGLSIARDIVERAGGAITLSKSELGGLNVTTRWPSTPA